MTASPPIPENESKRVLALTDLDLDYTDLHTDFQELTKLAAKVAGTEVSLINLIDTYTQWSVSSFGLDLEQMPREESVCQYTIMEEKQFEVKDLSTDERFHDKFYVTDDPSLRYYFGIPLRTASGDTLGALCVLDAREKVVEPEKIELLKIIAREVVQRINTSKNIQILQRKLTEMRENQKKVAHDIRGPIGGIMGLSQLIAEQGDDNSIEEMMEVFNLIHKSSNSLLELADEILSSESKNDKKPNALMGFELHLLSLKEKLEKLYSPQAKNKKIHFSVQTSSETETIPFSKNKLLQIAGNLISNSIKFTPDGGQVLVRLDLKIGDQNKILKINVKDTGVGLTEEKINSIISGAATSSTGTDGEKGYGFGLALVKHLVGSLNGSMRISSQPGTGSDFEIELPLQ